MTKSMNVADCLRDASLNTMVILLAYLACVVAFTAFHHTIRVMLIFFTMPTLASRLGRHTKDAGI